ncbi:MAG: hypothetical protein AAFQ57_04945, partial [Cyanobacteria bacterium J06626_14]
THIDRRAHGSPVGFLLGMVDSASTEIVIWKTQENQGKYGSHLIFLFCQYMALLPHRFEG